MVRQLDRLDRLAAFGMEVAEAIVRRAKDETDEAPSGDIALAFDRAARAVRLTVSLQSLLIAQIDARDDGREIAGPAGGRAASNDDDYYDDDEPVRSRWREPESEEAERADAASLNPAAPRDRADRERPDRDRYADLLKLPFAEVIAHICQDLGLDPDSVRRELDSGRTDIALTELLNNPPLPAGEGDREAVVGASPPRPPDHIEAEAEGP